MQSLKAAVAQHQSVVLRAPCGFGKSVLAALIMRGAQDKGNRAVFGAHRRQLVQQLSNTLTRAGVRHTLAMGGEPYDPSAPCVVGVTDTLAAHPEIMDGCKLYIVDEAHLHANGARAAVIERVRDAGGKSILITATPLASGNKTLGHLAQHIVHGPSVTSLIASGNLAQFQCYEAVRPDLSGLRSSGGDYATTALEERFSKPEIVGDAVSAYQRFANGKRLVGYCYSRAHAAMMVAAFKAAGIPTGYVDGETPDDERMRISHQLADREMQVLMSIQLLTEGYDLGSLVGRDVPIEGVGLYRPTKSVSLAVQMTMRPMRPQPGKAIIIDHAGVLFNHGWPDDEREWSLDAPPKRKADEEKAEAITTCKVCFAIYKPAAACCPVCGTARQPTPKEIKQREGEIAEAVRRDERRQVSAARTIADLQVIAKARGYAAGWVRHRAEFLQSKGILRG